MRLVSKMFIIWLPVYGEQKQVQDKWFDRGQKMEVLLAHGDNSTLQRLSIESKIKMQMHHVEKVYLVKN